MTKKDLKNLLNKRPGYIKGWSANKLADRFNIDIKIVKDVISEVKNDMRNIKLSKRAFNNLDPDNVLVIGDLHEPFCLKEYLEFCIEQRHKYSCGRVVFIGDIVDNHFTSYHEISPQAMGPNRELKFAKRKISRWHKAFPIADVIIGNHDRLVARKAQTAGIADDWLKSYDEVLDVPGWDFVTEKEIHGVMYAHGEGGTARKKMRDEHQSYVQGHLHSQAYIEWSVGSRYKTFGMQIGCGIDRKSFAMAYGKAFKKPVISCGVVLNKGRFAQVIPMDL